MKLDNLAPDISIIESYLSYDPETGDFRFKRSAGKKAAGSEAGYLNNLGYRMIMIKGRWMMGHRLAWRMTFGKWPEKEIDHINGNPSDNRICNLREATRSQQVANQKFNTRNSSGFRGVTERKRFNTPARYQASIRHNGHQRFLGIFTTPEEAHAAYLKAAMDLHGEYFAADGENVKKPSPVKMEQVKLI